MAGVFSIRPRFTQTLDLGPEEAQRRLARAVEEGTDPCEMKIFPGFICLRIPEQDRHFWSPRLNLGLETTEDGRTRIEGIYGPNANVWSLFLYGYLIVGTLGLFSGIFGLAQCLIGRPPWALWIFGAMLALALGLHALARSGRKLGELQTLRLHRIYEAAMGRAAELR
jgi:hypothetical protein